MISRLRSMWLRHQKSRPTIWLSRWNAACKRLWVQFGRKTPSLATFESFQSRHQKLLRLSERKLRLFSK